MTVFSRYRRPLPHTLLVCALLVATYYLAPVEPDATGPRLVIRTVATAGGVVLVAALITHLIVRLVRDESAARDAVALVVALFGGLMVFAFVDYLLAVSRPGQFEGLETKTDALYFAVTTLATVGFGDIHASGQLARVVVTGQQLFNLAVLATGATVLVNRLARAGRPAARPGQERPQP